MTTVNKEKNRAKQLSNGVRNKPGLQWKTSIYFTRPFLDFHRGNFKKNDNKS